MPHDILAYAMQDAARQAGGELRLGEVFEYLEDCDAKLLAELALARDVLHRRPPRGWTVAQVAHHLILAERTMLAIWKLAPALSRWPRVRTAIGRANTAMWRALGMEIVEPLEARISPENAMAGRFRTPRFLDPKPRRMEYADLLAWRRTARARTRRAIEKLDNETLHRVTWILPHSGAYPLIELVRFIGIHEMHHVPQIRRLREL